MNEIWKLTLKEIRDYFFECPWHEVYDFIEYIANECPSSSNNSNTDFMNVCNKMLEREVSAYRFVEGRITQITSEVEITEIKEALDADNYFKSVTNHLGQALNLMPDRKSPDYRNSIKESILAVEAICQLITSKDKTTLGQALGEVEKSKYTFCFKKGI